MEKIPYSIYLNEGTEGFNEKKTLTVGETPVDLSATELAREVHHANALIPQAVAEGVINSLMDVIAQKLAEGYRISLRHRGEAYLSLYADLHLKQTFDLAEARKRGFTGTELTLEAAPLITANDITLRARAEVEQKFTEAVRTYCQGIQRTDSKTRPFVRKKGSTTEGNNQGGGSVMPPLGNE